MLPLQSVDNPAGRFANSFWMAVLRNSWGFAIAWVILACHCGSGGIFKWFLELPCWQPLGRMSLSFYLVHSVYQTVSIGSGKVPIHFNMRNLVRRQIEIEFENQFKTNLRFLAAQLRWRLCRFLLPCNDFLSDVGGANFIDWKLHLQATCNANQKGLQLNYELENWAFGNFLLENFKEIKWKKFNKIMCLTFFASFNFVLESFNLELRKLLTKLLTKLIRGRS